jgi:hypothetical protein
MENDVTKKAIKPAPAKSEPESASPSIAKGPIPERQQNRDKAAESKPKQTPKPAAAPKAKPSTTPQSRQRQPKSQSKQDRVVAMLRQPDGTTVATIMKATGWQKHSVHGFLAGVVRKKLGLNLVSELKDDARVYRIVERSGGKVTASSRKRAA